MSSMMMVERQQLNSGVGMSSPAAPSGMTGMQTAPNMVMVPRCTMKLEKCPGGFKLQCCCEDEVACATLQNLCKMTAGSLCSMVCTMNGMTVMQCNMCMCSCTCECTEDGVCVTCKSGDKACCDMLQACCAAMACCLENGCCCCLCFGGTPCCCGCC